MSGWGFVPDSTEGAYDAALDTLVGWEGASPLPMQTVPPQILYDAGLNHRTFGAQSLRVDESPQLFFRKSAPICTLHNSTRLSPRSACAFCELLSTVEWTPFPIFIHWMSARSLVLALNPKMAVFHPMTAPWPSACTDVLAADKRVGASERVHLSALRISLIAVIVHVSWPFY